MKMKNEQVISKFAQGFSLWGGKKIENYSKSLRIEDNKLMNYQTCIGEWFEGKLFINMTKYSMTTTKHQNMLKFYAFNYTEVHDIPQGQSSLVPVRHMMKTQN